MEKQAIDKTELDRGHVRKIVRALVVIVLCKLTFLLVMFFLFFSPSHRESGDLRNLFSTPSESREIK